MALRNLSDQDLLAKTEALARQERELLIQVLHHLKEIERRRLFSSSNYRSLFDYCLKRLGYSADQAARRISAMRLLKELPEIESKIETGSLTLTSLGLAQTLFRHEQKIKDMSKESKLNLLTQLEHKTTREAEKIVAGASSAPLTLMPDRTRAVTQDIFEIKFMADEPLTEKLEQLRGLLAHSQPNCSMNELLNKVCDVAIERLSPALRQVRSRKAASLPASINNPVSKNDSVCNLPAAPLVHCGKESQREHVSASVRREVWRKAGGSCQRCGSRSALQVDHILPAALGGRSGIGNLRLLCRCCNQRAAIEAFGQQVMDGFLEV